MENSFSLSSMSSVINFACDLFVRWSSHFFIFFFFPDGKDTGRLQLETPDDVDISIEFKDWLFALEGAQEAAEKWWFCDHEDSIREERCWHTTFRNICVKASSSKHVTDGSRKLSGKKRYPLELITVSTLFLLCNYLPRWKLIKLDSCYKVLYILQGSYCFEQLLHVEIFDSSCKTMLRQETWQ